MDELLSDRGLRTPFLRIAASGVVRAAADFTRGGGAGATINDQVADDRIADLLASGNSVVLQGLHRTHAAVGAFTRQLTGDLGHPVQANAYLTPSGNQGFASHYDTHDVFVCQIAGSKNWRIHRPVIVRPNRDQPWELVKKQVADAAEGQPFLDVRMDPGDCLYLPRGWLHAAVAIGEEPSLHLTFGVHVVTRMAILQAAMAHVATDESARHALPMGAELGGDSAAASGLRELTTLLSQLPTDKLSESVRRLRDADTRPEPLLPSRQAEAIRTLGITSTVRRRAHLGVTQSWCADGILITSALDRRPLTFDWQLSDTIKHLLSGDDVVVGALPGPQTEVLAAVDRLMRAGILISPDPV